MTTKSTAAEQTRAAAEPGTLVLVCLAAWVIPGAGHLWMGRRQKRRRVSAGAHRDVRDRPASSRAHFSVRVSEPLVALAAVANVLAGGPWMIARILEAGGGVVTASTYEAGNCFLIVAGLLNFLVMLDAFDIGMGRK